MARIAVTGGTGFVGIHTTKALVRAGHEVRLLARGRRRVARQQGVTLVRADVAGGAGLAEALTGVDTVVHLVAVIREKRRETFDAVIAQGTRHVVEAARAAGVRHLVYVSAIGAAPDPRYGYLAAKWQAEQHVRGGGVPYTILRPSLLFGPGDGFFTRLVGLMRLPAPVPVVGDGRALFQPLAITDFARIVQDVVERGNNGDATVFDRVFEVGGPEHLTYEQIVTVIRGVLGYNTFPRMLLHVPVQAMLPLAFMMDKVLPNPPVTPDQLRLLEKHNITRLDAVPSAFGFAPLAFASNATYLQDY